MPADVDLAAEARVGPLREPLATVAEEVGIPVPAWLLARAAVVRAGVYAGPQPGYLIWIKGEDLDAGMRARLVLSPDWFYVTEPFPHFRSVDAAALMPGADVLVLTNLPLQSVLDAFAADAFPLPAAAASAEGAADLLLIVPDLTAALEGLAADSRLDGLAAAFGLHDLWLSGTTSADGLHIEGAAGTGGPRLARILAALAARTPALADLRLQPDGASVTLWGVIGYEPLINAARAVLGPAEVGELGEDGAP